jgi:hypothetical protein
MGLRDWFRRLFSPSPHGPAEDLAILRAEDGEGAADEATAGGMTDAELQRIRAQRGATGFTGLEVAEAAEDAIDAADAPSDPAP